MLYASCHGGVKLLHRCGNDFIILLAVPFFIFIRISSFAVNAMNRFATTVPPILLATQVASLSPARRDPFSLQCIAAPR